MLALQVNVFAKETNNKFNQNEYQHMIISYDNKGVPVLAVPEIENNYLARAANVRVISPYGYFYEDKSLTKLLFSIPRGNYVELLDTELDVSGVAKVQYAGFTGYIRKSNLEI